MAQSVTVTEVTAVGTIKKIKWVFTTDTDGTVESQTTGVFDGKLIAVHTIPDSTSPPTADWDLTITDEDGADVCAGAGANRSASVQEVVTEASLGAVASQKLQLNIINGGSGLKGTVIAYIR